MKQKINRILSLLLCLVMVLGLMPMTAFAEGTREEVDTIKATAIINVPSYGEPTLSGIYSDRRQPCIYCCYDDSLGKEKHSDRKMG